MAFEQLMAEAAKKKGDEKKKDKTKGGNASKADEKAEASKV